MRVRFLILAVVAAFALLGCEETLEKIIEAETGCSESQLGTKVEADLPNCSKAISCCMFLKGECGNVQLFDAPETVITICNTNEELLGNFIDTYRDLEEGDCPEYLDQEECDEGYDKTKENYINVVDGGTGDLADMSPSCKMIVDETVTTLNEALGDDAKYLPEACEQL